MTEIEAAGEMSKPQLSIVIPCFNEEECLPHTLAELTPALDAAVDGSWELVLVDDGSRDGTIQIIAEAHRADSRIRGVSLSRNFGHQAAIATGLAFASGRHVGIIDADLQDPVSVLVELYQNVAGGKCDISVGRRNKRDAPLLLRIGYRVFYKAINRLSVPPWPRDAGDFCVFNQRVHEVLLGLPERARTLRGLRSWVGFRQSFVAYDRPARTHGSSKYNLWRLGGLALDSFVAFSNVPLRLASIVGISMSFGTIAIAALFLLNRLFPQATLLGYWVGANPGVTTVVLYLSFIASILFFCLGIIGEYVLLLLREVQGRPTAIVDTLVGLAPGPRTQANHLGTTLVASSREMRES